jgi:peroxiredoxin
MKTRIFLACTMAALMALVTASPAAEKGNATADLKAVVSQIQAKLKEGKNTEADLSEQIKQFDVLLERHKGEKTDDVAQILFMKATLYVQVLDQTDKGVAMLQQLKTDFPETRQGQQVDRMIASIQQQEEGKKIQRALAPGAAFPEFTEKELDGKPLSIGGYKGKVVLVDFWATWCGPCIAELPNVLSAYKKHHANGFEIIGISLDSDEKTLRDFIQKHNMPWPQFFDGKGWGNKLAKQYGVNSIPATYLLDAEGKIIAKGLRGPALEQAVAKALSK